MFISSHRRVQHCMKAIVEDLHLLYGCALFAFFRSSRNFRMSSQYSCQSVMRQVEHWTPSLCTNILVFRFIDLFASMELCLDRVVFGVDFLGCFIFYFLLRCSRELGCARDGEHI